MTKASAATKAPAEEEKETEFANVMEDVIGEIGITLKKILDNQYYIM